MLSLRRTKVKKERQAAVSNQSIAEVTTSDSVTQLHVDVYQTEEQIVVYAQAAGATVRTFNVSIEGDADFIIIEGNRDRSSYAESPTKSQLGSLVVEECVWGDFYRRIILPERVDIDKAEAKFKNGVLILTLPLLISNQKISGHTKLTNNPKFARKKI